VASHLRERARNRYADSFDVTDVSIQEVFVQLGKLQFNEFEEARITGVEFSGSVSSVFTRYSLGSVLLRRPDGTLSPLPTDRPLQVVAGSRLNLRVVLVPYRNFAPPRTLTAFARTPRPGRRPCRSACGGLRPRPSPPSRASRCMISLGNYKS
jgi:hypothetical protein